MTTHQKEETDAKYTKAQQVKTRCNLVLLQATARTFAWCYLGPHLPLDFASFLLLHFLLRGATFVILFPKEHQAVLRANSTGHLLLFLAVASITANEYIALPNHADIPSFRHSSLTLQCSNKRMIFISLTDNWKKYSSQGGVISRLPGFITLEF